MDKIHHRLIPAFLILFLFHSTPSYPADQAEPVQLDLIFVSLQNDSLTVYLRQCLIDSLRSLEKSINNNTPNLLKIKIDSTNDGKISFEFNKGAPEISGVKPTNPIFLVSFENMERADSSFTVFLLDFVQNPSQGVEIEETELLESKIIKPTYLVLNKISIKNFSTWKNYLSGFVCFYSDKYPEAIDAWEKLPSFYGRFYSGIAFLQQHIRKHTRHSFGKTHLDSSTFYLKKSLVSAISLFDTACVLNNIGVSFQLSQNLDSAIVYFKKAQERLKSLNNNSSLITVSNNLGYAFLLSGKWGEALAVFNSSIETMEAINDSIQLASTYENLGNIYQLIFQRNNAIEYHHHALDIRKQLNDKSGMAASYRYLGDVYSDKKDFNSAEMCFQESLKLNDTLGNELEIAKLYDRLSRVYFQLGNPNEALSCFQKSIELFEKLNNKNSLIQVLKHQADFYQESNDYEKAISIYERALQISEKIENTSFSALLYDRLGDIFSRQKNLPQALDYYERSADLYRQTEDYENLSLLLYNMGLIRLKQNDFEEGYYLMTEALQLDDKHGFKNLSNERSFVRKIENFLRNP